jgi:hypothetical protein
MAAIRSAAAAGLLRPKRLKNGIYPTSSSFGQTRQRVRIRRFALETADQQTAVGIKNPTKRADGAADNGQRHRQRGNIGTAGTEPGSESEGQDDSHGRHLFIWG